MNWGAALRRIGTGQALAAGLICASASPAADLPGSPVARATFTTPVASAAVLQLSAWVVAREDNQGLPYVIVDKAGARAFAVAPDGTLVATAPVLLGAARGDDSPPGIGTRKLATITPGERITPAGRFVAALGENISGHAILWVDYDAALSLHPVITTKPAERRLERLSTPSVSDNRISFGCINVPATFFATIVAPLFKGTVGIVYILPETRTLQTEFFGGSAETPPPGANPH